MRRAKINQNPEQLTIAKLKTELRKHGVPLPHKTALKAEYINLYRDKVQDAAEFSSDDDINNTKQNTRARNTELRVKIEKLPDTMTIRGIDVQELTDDELRTHLKQRGFSIGPILQSTRALYKKKLERALNEGGGSGDSKPPEYSDQDSYEDDEDEEPEIEVAVPVEPRRTRSSLLQPSAEKGFSSAPNLTTLEYSQPAPKPLHRRGSPHPRDLKSRHEDAPPPRVVSEPLTPSWVNISMSDDGGLSKSFAGKGVRGRKEGKGTPKGFNSFNVGAGGYKDFQRGLYFDEGLRLREDVPVNDSYVNVVDTTEPFMQEQCVDDVINNTESTTHDRTVGAERSRMHLEVTGNSSTFSIVQQDLDATLENSEQILNSTKIEKQQQKFLPPPRKPLPVSHLTHDLLSPHISASAYSKRIKRIWYESTLLRWGV